MFAVETSLVIGCRLIVKVVRYQLIVKADVACQLSTLYSPS
jgi:hypothetical protein